MGQDIRSYFEETIIPLIVREYPRVAAQMSIRIQGSYGLGIVDEFSDLDATIYLDDPLWKDQGGQLQLMLEHIPHSFAKTVGHPEICVHPLSWLGDLRGFLENKEDLPWEKVTFEGLFELQENLVLRDPQKVFSILKTATAPERFPPWLWKKRLILELKKLIYDDLGELESAVKRGQLLEGHIILASLLEDLIHIGFILNKKYYPWRKHLRWAFEKLPLLASLLSPAIEVILSSSDWKEKLELIWKIRDVYFEYLEKNKVLPEIDFSAADLSHELIAAERHEAWSNPNWHERQKRYEQKAVEGGYDRSDGWIWSLWDRV